MRTERKGRVRRSRETRGSSTSRVEPEAGWGLECAGVGGPSWPAAPGTQRVGVSSLLQLSGRTKLRKSHHCQSPLVVQTNATHRWTAQGWPGASGRARR